MNKLNILQRQAEVGCNITLRLVAGGSVIGIITDLNDEFVTVDLDDRTVTVFSESISTWELPKTTSRRNDIAPTDAPPEPTRPDPDSGLGHLHHSAKPRPTVPSVEEPATSRRIELAEKAAFGASIQQAKITAPAWNTSFVGNEFPDSARISVKTKWDRARSQYEYALKIRERSRLNTILIQTLEPLIEQFPASPSLRLFAAQLLLELDRPRQAEEHCKLAAATSMNPQSWYALAYAAEDQTPVVCYALRQYFLAAEPASLGSTWFRFLRTALDLWDISGLVAVFTALFQHSDTQENIKILQDSLIFALFTANLEADARAYADAVMQGTHVRIEELYDRLSKSASGACASIAEVERELNELAHPTPRIVAERTPQTEMSQGHITSFGSRMFGFIEDLYGEKHFFRITDVEEEDLRTSLLANAWRNANQVDFVSVPSYGQMYRKASKVVSHVTLDKLIELGEQAYRRGNVLDASSYLKRIKAAATSDERVMQLEHHVKQLVRQRMKMEGVGLPKGEGPYARAKRAQLVDQDLEKAEQFYREALAKDDKVESAVKDLASLLQQRGDSTKAIDLVLHYRSRIKSRPTPYDNLLATLYQHAGRHGEAIETLNELLERSSISQTPVLLRRITISQFHSKRYTDAESTLTRLLTIRPGDSIAERWLATLEEARKSGDYGEAEHMFPLTGDLADSGIELSFLAQRAIKNCSFEGVDPSKIPTNRLSARDVERLEDLAKQLGTKRPGDRAGYYLSAAAILDRLAPEENSSRIHDYLRRYFASMGDWAWFGKKSADVVRSYYVESLGLVSKLDLDEAWRTLVRYLGSHWPENIQKLENKLPRRERGERIGVDAYINSYREILGAVAEIDAETALKSIRYLCTQSSFVEKATHEAIGGDRTLCELFNRWIGAGPSDPKEVEVRWKHLLAEESRRLRRNVYYCEGLSKHQLTSASMEEVATQLRRLETGACTLDLDRIRRLSDIVAQAHSFCRASEYEDKEQHYWMVTTQSDTLESAIKNLPTQFSFQALLPVALHIRSLVEEDYAQLQISAAPQIELRLLIDHYVPDRRGEIRLQVQVANKPGCSPASSVVVHLGPAESCYYRAESYDHSLGAAVRGGASIVTQIGVCPKDQAVKDKAFPVHIEASYRNRLSEECRTGISEWPIRLYDSSSFVEVENPYAPYAEGGPVDNPAMFVGREDLIEKLTKTLVGSASKHVVMFGQKRAGKSSVLEHLRRRLVQNADCVASSFSLQDGATTLSEFSFLFRVLQSIDENFADLREAGVEVPRFKMPSMLEMKEEPTLVFHQTMSRFVREMRASPDGLPRKIVLLIDEFTEIYKQIKRGRIDRDFMKVWKAIVEKKYFSSVLVGQDIMPEFKATYPNEFGVTEDIRLTYLHVNDALSLIEVPLGSDRFVGKSTRRIVDLTDGSPYYTMMYCKRLVDYMNATRSAVVTEADVNAVEQDMLSGNGRLARDKFDNLICAGDGKEDSGIDPEDSFALCASIAKNADKGWCAESNVVDKDDAFPVGLITDLERRDVVEKKGNAIRLRVGIFNDWLVMNA